ncbi:MAG TPA: sensor histidine kinase [Nitrospiria bacterium]|nr:sensor histidine kinase [Nitrospiria bacterium]
MTHVVIIGAGRGGTSLLEIFYKDPLVKILGIADRNPQAPGLKLAKKLRIPTATDYRKLLTLKHLEILIDVTGAPEVERELQRLKPPEVAVIGGPTAKFMWQLIEAQIKSKDELEHHLIEYQALFRLYMREARHAVMEERTRIALDLHDGLVQTLVGLNYKMDLLDQILFADPEKVKAALTDTRDLLKNAIEEARQVVFNLKPIYFEKLDLLPALRGYLKSYEKQYGIATTLKAMGEEARIPPRTKVFLFRIVQEALSNVQKHARAKQVHLQVQVGDKDLKAVIQDDGIGFDLEEISQSPEKWASFGLRGIEERAKLLGGTASIQSKPKQGTTIRVTLPLEEKEELLPRLKLGQGVSA